MTVTSESNSVVVMVLNCLASVVLTTITKTNTHVHFHLLSILNILDYGSMNMPSCFIIYLWTIFISINFGTLCVCERCETFCLSGLYCGLLCPCVGLWIYRNVILRFGHLNHIIYFHTYRLSSGFSLLFI